MLWSVTKDSASVPRRRQRTATGLAFPERLRQLRKERGWSQAEVARQIGVQRVLIGNYELGINQPTIGIAAKLAHLFGTSLDGLILATPAAADQIHDHELLSFFKKADALPYETKAMIKSLIEGLLAKVELQKIRQENTSKAV